MVQSKTRANPTSNINDHYPKLLIHINVFNIHTCKRATDGNKSPNLSNNIISQDKQTSYRVVSYSLRANLFLKLSKAAQSIQKILIPFDI